MRRFMLKDWKLAKVTTCTTATGNTTDTSTYLDTKGYENLCVLFRADSTTGDPTINLKLKSFSASTGASGATTAGSISWTAGTTGDLGGINAPVDVDGVANRYYAVKLTTTGGTAKIRSFYFLGGARHQPVSHITTVKSTTVCT